MTADEALQQKQQAFAREQARTAQDLADKYGAALLEKYGPQKYFAWETATKKAGTR